MGLFQVNLLLYQPFYYKHEVSTVWTGAGWIVCHAWLWGMTWSPILSPDLEH